MTIERILLWAKRHNRIANGLVLCELCDTPASKSMALKMSWVGCAPCYLGESDAFDLADVIHVDTKEPA